uniref:Uncharacterized protein n=1 Tax=Ficus carica TaxID=3494 RepID=A0AA87YP44_FICCA|nr:hypothetical protein TIFTF001_048608 [Ficus carica]
MPTSRGREVSAQHAVSHSRVAAEEVATKGEAVERTASQASTSVREGSESSGSSAPRGEPIEARQRPSGRPMRINDQRVYRRGDWEMVELADGRPVYSVDYFTSAITPRYLAALREEFDIPPSVELLAPGADDLLSRPPPGYITLSAEYFGAGLRLPFHPFLRRALTRLNVAPAQLNANAYRILGFKGTFITSCPDGRWLHRELPYSEVPSSSSSSGRADDQPRVPGTGVTIARMSEPTVHYHSQTGGLSVAQQISRLAPPPSEPSSGNESAPGGSFGTQVADEDLNRVIQEFYPARGLRIEEPMADRQQSRKRPSDEERRAKLLKMARTSSHGKGKTILPSSQPPSQPAAARPADRHEHRSSRSKDDRPTSRPEVRSSYPREDPRSREIVPSSRPETSSRDSPAHRALVNKISDKLSDQVAESCRRLDAVTALCISISGSAVVREATNWAADDLRAAESAARDARSTEKAAKEARNLARDVEKKAIEEAKVADARAKAAKERAQRAEKRIRAAKEWAQTAEKDASDARQQLEEAGQKAKADLQSDEFQARLVAEYKDGMRDMKLGFTDAQPYIGWGELVLSTGGVRGNHGRGCSRRGRGVWRSEGNRRRLRARWRRAAHCL